MKNTSYILCVTIKVRHNQKKQVYKKLLEPNELKARDDKEMFKAIINNAVYGHKAKN